MIARDMSGRMGRPAPGTARPAAELPARPRRDGPGPGLPPGPRPARATAWPALARPALALPALALQALTLAAVALAALALAVPAQRALARLALVPRATARLANARLALARLATALLALSPLATALRPTALPANARAALARAAALPVVALLLLAPGFAAAQGYAGLGSAAEGFAQATRPADLEFPRDHGAHPDFRIEWWYLTAALTGEDGRAYGAQWTLFRVATRPGPEAPGWASNQVWIGHAAVTAEDDHRSAERFARGGVGQAGVTAAPFAAWIDDWTLESRAAPGADPLDAIAVTAAGPGFAFALEGAATGPLVRHGDDGFSLKALAGQASYYYSQPFLRLSGTLTLGDRRVAVTGSGWIDREWSSQQMSPDQTGWDWFSLHLDDGSRLMAYRLRESVGPSQTFGSWIAPDGRTRALAPGEIVMTPLRTARVAGRDIPVAWRLEAPGIGLAVDTEAVNAQSWMDGEFPYWEGPIRVTGTHPGRGYLELVGY